MSRMRAPLSILILMLSVTSLTAQTQRTFVATTGADTNPCSRLSPCRSFSAAIALTLSGGEVYVLDTGGYGPASITTPITLRAEGVSAGITVFSGSGIQVSIGSATTDVVSLVGLTINSIALGGSVGISFAGAGTLHIERCTISGFQDDGIEMTGSGQMFVDHSLIRDCSGNQGLWAHTTSGVANVSVDSCDFENNNVAVEAGAGSRMVVRNSLAAGNFSTGFYAVTIATGSAEMTLENCVAAFNNHGIISEVQTGGPSIVRMSNVTVYGNVTGLAEFGGTIVSFGNNQVLGNTTDGSPSSTVPRV